MNKVIHLYAAVVHFQETIRTLFKVCAFKATEVKTSGVCSKSLCYKTVLLR